MCPASHTPLNSRLYLRFVCTLMEMTDAAVLPRAGKMEFYTFENLNGGKGLYGSWFGSFLIETLPSQVTLPTCLMGSFNLLLRTDNF